MKSHFQLETKCSGWSCQHEKFQLSPFIVVCYSWTVEHNSDKFAKLYIAGRSPDALLSPVMRRLFLHVACQDNLLNLPFSSWHLLYQYYYLRPISLDMVEAEGRSLCIALF